MRPLFAIILLLTSFFSDLAVAQNFTPTPILPSTFHWRSPPNMSGIQGAWVLGAEQNQGLYIFRVKLEFGASIPPHTHPDERNTTVLTGSISVGIGEKFDETKVVAIPAGAGIYRTGKRSALRLGKRRRSSVSRGGDRSDGDFLHREIVFSWHTFVRVNGRESWRPLLCLLGSCNSICPYLV
jgi:hypothetical protein